MTVPINSHLPPALKIPMTMFPHLHHDSGLLIDVQSFTPVVVSSMDRSDVRVQGSFNLANLEQDASKRLRALVDFIRTAQHTSTQGLYVECTHAIAEQLAYLAYWKDYPLEFQLARFTGNIVVLAHLPTHSEFDCVLAIFDNTQELHRGVQSWFECFCQLVRDHAKIWQIHLIVDKRIYRKLEEPRFGQPDLLIEVVDEP